MLRMSVKRRDEFGGARRERAEARGVQRTQHAVRKRQATRAQPSPPRPIDKATGRRLGSGASKPVGSFYEHP